jgi:hypothetical protein
LSRQGPGDWLVFFCPRGMVYGLLVGGFNMF